METIGVAIMGAIVGGFAAAAAVVFWLGWGVTGQGQLAHADPTRGDYVDLLLTLVTILLGAIGLAVTVGAVVIGLVALKTLREIKDDAASAAKEAAAIKITKIMDEELEPNVNAKVKEAMSPALQAALLKDELGHKILTKMAQLGELDEVLERVAMRMQGGGPEFDSEEAVNYANGDNDHA
ncbi:MAG: hypothetical protein J4F49_05430 [Rhodobacteraceae bacterium]|nr:hypothetical protein [Paracoccaceae bacterium]